MSRDYDLIKTIKITGLLTCAVAVLAVAGGSFYTVDEGERAVILHWGEFAEVSDPGLHWKMPISTSVKFYDTRVKKTNFDDLQAYSHDQQIIERYNVAVSWSYDPDRIDELYRIYGNTLINSIVSPMVQQNSKVILGQYTAQTIIQNRAELSDQITNSLKNDLKSYPIKIFEVRLEDVNFSKSYEQIIEQTSAKKLEIDKARNELQRVDLENQQKVKQAESENKAMKLQAEANAYKTETEAKATAEALKTRAEAEAYAIEIKSKAEAQALELKGKALQSHPNLVQMQLAEKWSGEVPRVSLGGKDVSSAVMPVFRMEALEDK